MLLGIGFACFLIVVVIIAVILPQNQ